MKSLLLAIPVLFATAAARTDSCQSCHAADAGLEDGTPHAAAGVRCTDFDVYGIPHFQ